MHMVCVSERWGGEGRGWQAKERRCREGGVERGRGLKSRGREVRAWGVRGRGGAGISEMPPHCLRIDGMEWDERNTEWARERRV